MLKINYKMNTIPFIKGYVLLYYKQIKSIRDIVGEEGIWRLPAYINEVFIKDKEREIVIEKTIKNAISGKNTLIIGSPGTGKTALMAIVLFQMLQQRIPVGIIYDGALIVGKDHEEKGMILFYDDLPRARISMIKSLFQIRPHGIIATARKEELEIIQKITGKRAEEIFEILEVPKMGKEDLKKMTIRYATREQIKIEEKEAIDHLVEKAEGLPIYIWQTIRDLRIRKQPLNGVTVKETPVGMYNYVDKILWRILDAHRERFMILLLLLIMTDLFKHAINIDVFNILYIIIKEKWEGKLLSKEALLSNLLDKTTRYLIKDQTTYTYKLPHDTWADVLRGKSSGPMSHDITRINTAYPKQRRKELLKEAVKRAKKYITPHKRENYERFIKINEGNI